MTVESFNRIYRFDSEYTPSEEFSMVSKLDVREQQDIYEFVKSLRGGEIEDMMSIYIMNDYEISNFNKFSELTGISYKITDITSDVILGDYDSNSDSITEEIISEFLKDNLTADIILDKINIKGIESLSKIDLEILKS